MPAPLLRRGIQGPVGSALPAPTSRVLLRQRRVDPMHPAGLGSLTLELERLASVCVHGQQAVGSTAAQSLPVMFSTYANHRWVQGGGWHGSLSRFSAGGGCGEPQFLLCTSSSLHDELKYLHQEQRPCSWPMRGSLRVCAALAVGGEGQGALGWGQRGRVCQVPLLPLHWLL